MNEFEIIKNYFATQMDHRDDVIHGIGDDAAIVQVPQGHELAVTTDTLVSGIHFPEASSAYDIGYKALAVNLSDLAAVGATPAWATLSLTLSQGNTDWIQEFCAGFFTLANQFRVQLIGGDLSHGPLSITVQALGFVPIHQALLRSSAKPDDLIYVSGSLGDAGVALQFLQKKITLDPAYQNFFLARLNRPYPRIAVGEQLRGIAHAAIDISDGLVADLNHILEESQLGASINVDHLPLSEELMHALPRKQALALALTAGDDYELCFTIPKENRNELEKKLSTIPCRYTCIGTITENRGVDLQHENGEKYSGPVFGYQHF